jgi:NADPH2:quinone reductase
LNLVLLKGIVVTGFENRTIMDHLPDVAPAHRAEVLQMLLDGKIHPHISSSYPLDDVVSALRELADRRAIGKVVVEIGTES